MVSIRAKNVGLRYPVPRDVKLKGELRTTVGGRFFARGGRRFVTALEDVSFELKPGDRLGLVGANGAGKTTLLKVLYGIYEPTAGSLEAQGFGWSNSYGTGKGEDAITSGIGSPGPRPRRSGATASSKTCSATSGS